MSVLISCIIEFLFVVACQVYVLPATHISSDRLVIYSCKTGLTCCIYVLYILYKLYTYLYLSVNETSESNNSSQDFYGILLIFLDFLTVEVEVDSSSG